MDFNLFMYCTIGRPQELKAGMAGKRPEPYQRMLQEIAGYIQVAEQAGYTGFGYPSTTCRSTGFEVANEFAAISVFRVNECFRLIPRSIHERGQDFGSLELFANRIAPSFARR